MENPVLKVRPFRVEEIKWESLNIFTLVVIPVDPTDMIRFLPGQWVYMHLLNPDGTTWARAALSIATAPSQSADRFELTIKMHGDYTKRASQLQPDDIVGIQGPFGVFVLKEQADPIVIFAGGIGITPFRSMIHELHQKKSPNKVYLFYSNRDHEDTAFYEEFDDLNKDWPSFTPIFTLTGTDVPARWKGETGRIHGSLIQKYVPNLAEADILMCGPVTFMDAIAFELDAIGVNTKKQLRKELFGN